MKFFDFSNLRGDMFGGITAGIVALPLALAFGEASGAGPIAGIWGAIFVGFFASLFGGTGSNVSGPTGPMVVVFAGVFASLSGNPALVFAAVVLAGVLQILLGVFKMGQYIRLVPYPVVSGFMSGIGCIIIALQLSRLVRPRARRRRHNSCADGNTGCNNGPQYWRADCRRNNAGNDLYLAFETGQVCAGPTGCSDNWNDSQPVC